MRDTHTRWQLRIQGVLMICVFYEKQKARRQVAQAYLSLILVHDDCT